MGKTTIIIIYVVVMIVAVVAIDVLFLRHQTWERLAVNIGIVLVFIAFYLR
jgi:hypothetical protein